MIRHVHWVVVLLLPLTVAAEDKKPVPFRSKEGKFSVALPAKPTEKANKVMTDAGEIDLHVALVDQKDRAMAVMYNDYLPGSVAVTTPEKVLAGCITGNVNALKGKLLSEANRTLGKAKHPGREILIEMPDKKSFYRARLFLVGDRLYQVVALGPDDYAKSKAVDEFLDSFAVSE